jgi:hypothetical protein
MRDKRFIAEHRGGLLKKAQQRQLIMWACGCSKHVMPFFGEKVDDRLNNALRVAKEWGKGNASVGDARKASLEAIAVANECSDPVSIAVARSVGHAVATAHMADHSLGAALYVLKAVKSAGKSMEEEREWQNEQLPREIRELVLTSRREKESALGIGKSDAKNAKRKGRENCARGAEKREVITQCR